MPARKYAIAYFASMPAPKATPSTSAQRQSGARSSFTQASNASAQHSSSGTSVEMMRVENTTPGNSVKARADQNAVRAAYRRTRFLEERIGLMQRWSNFVCGRGAVMQGQDGAHRAKYGYPTVSS